MVSTDSTSDRALIYLDANATTSLDSNVLDAMLPWFTDRFANAASTHVAGRDAAEAVERARQAVATQLGCRPQEVIFTSGATESNNLALRGIDGPVACPATEHKAVLDTTIALGGAVLTVDGSGRVDFETLENRCKASSLISVMAANNETGVLNDLRQVVELAHSAGCLVHSDMTQALGKVPVNVGDVGVDLASFSAHKLHGPKGVGALFIRRGVKLASVQTGGGHERGFRSGTLNVPGIVGFGTACDLLPRNNDAERWNSMRSVSCSMTSHLARLLEEGLEETLFFSDHRTGLPNTLSVRIVGCDGEALIANCPDIAMSVGSACTAAVPEPSHVLLAMGVSSVAAFETVRLSLDSHVDTTAIELAADHIIAAVKRVRSLNVGASR
jgi:cysteine desulfurase